MLTTTDGLRCVVVVAALVVLTGCGTSTDPASSSTDSGQTERASGAVADPSATSDATDPSGSQAPVVGRIQGTAESVDDVGTPDRVPVEGATLVVLPANGTDALWEAIDFVPDAAQLGTVGGLVEADVLGPDRLVAVEDGRFGLDVDDGDYLVCLLGGTGPYALRGCAEVTVSGPGTWHVSHGEGGFSLRTG